MVSVACDERPSQASPEPVDNRIVRFLRCFEIARDYAKTRLPVDLPQPSPARTPAWLPGVRNGADHEHPPTRPPSGSPDAVRNGPIDLADLRNRLDKAVTEVAIDELPLVIGMLAAAGARARARLVMPTTTTTRTYTVNATADRVAAEYNVPTSQIYELARRHQLPHVRLASTSGSRSRTCAGRWRAARVSRRLRLGLGKSAAKLRAYRPLLPGCYRAIPQAEVVQHDDQAPHARPASPASPAQARRQGVGEHLAAGSLDRRTWVAKEIDTITDALCADRGGESHVTAGEKLLVERIAAEVLICRAIEAWALHQAVDHRGERRRSAPAGAAGERLQRGMPPTQVAKILGHKDATITMKLYAHWYPGLSSAPAMADIASAILYGAGGSKMVAEGR